MLYYFCDCVLGQSALHSKWSFLKSLTGWRNQAEHLRLEAWPRSIGDKLGQWCGFIECPSLLTFLLHYEMEKAKQSRLVQREISLEKIKARYIGDKNDNNIITHQKVQFGSTLSMNQYKRDWKANIAVNSHPSNLEKIRKIQTENKNSCKIKKASIYWKKINGINYL